MRLSSFRTVLAAVLVVWTSIGLSAVVAASPFQDLYDLDRLPLLRPGVRTYQVSSHDPTGGNEDWGHFVRVSGNVRVLADLQGPGIVRRIWSANPSGRLRITIDGAREPVLDVTFTDLFEDKVPGFRSPVAGKSSGGWYSYVPIAFRSSCKITAVDSGPFYYQVTWQKVPEALEIRPFRGTFDEEDGPAYDAAVEAWSHLGTIAPDPAALELPRRTFTLPPAGRWAQPIHGPGTVTSIRFQFAPGTTFEDLRRAILRISFDGGGPSVEAPLGDFFGIGFNNVRWRSLALGADEDGAYCYFRMPFLKSARIEVENQGRRPLTATFTGTARSGVPAEPWGAFHATYRTAVNEPGQDYFMGRLRGRGHVVGVTESMRGNGALWFLEGDEKVFVDGEPTPSIYGTGTEDFYNCGWYFNTGTVNVATHGCSHKTDNEIGAWRMLIPDAIPFDCSLDFRIEHGGTDDVPGSEYSSVLYWYGAPGAHDTAGSLPEGAALLPRPFIAPIEGAIQAETAPWTPSKGTLAKRQMWQQLSNYRGGGRMLIKGRPGASASTPVEVRFTDLYDVELYLSGVNTTSTARLLVDGKPTGKFVQDSSGPFPIRKVSLGSLLLTEGKHTFGLQLTKGSVIALDAFRIAPRSQLVKDFAVLGPFPVDPAIGVNTRLPADGKPPELTSSSSDGSGVRWRILQAPSGILDLGATLSPNENVVAYASFAVKSPSDQTAPLMVGSDDGVAVWVNGTKVFTNRIDRGLKMDEDRIPVRLKSGWNTIVLKVDQKGVAWEVTARIPDPDGKLAFAAIAPGE